MKLCELIDRLGLGDEGLQAILGRDPSQHRDGVRLPQLVVDIYIGPQTAVCEAQHPSCGEHALVCEDDDPSLFLGLLDLRP